MSTPSRRRFGRTSLYVSMITGVCVAAGAFAETDRSQLLNGDYAFTQMQACVSSTEDFVVPAFELDEGTGTWVTLTNVESNVLTITGTSSFDGAGNWRSSGRTLSINQGDRGPGENPITESTFECDGTYEVAEDRTFRIDFTSCQLTSAPLTFGHNNTLEGKVSQDSKTLILWDVETTVDQYVLVPFDAVLFEQICTASATDIRAIR